MPRSSAQRMAQYRMRQRAAGMVTLSLAVPAQDAKLFTEFAAERRRQHHEHGGAQPKRSEWFSMILRSEAVAADAAASLSANPSTHPSTSAGLNAQAARSAARGKRPPRKRAEGLADEILRRIIKRGWPVGMPLGSEAELLKEHGVSRTVLRQAIRLLEHHSVARMRRGASGGLIVAQPDPAATARAVSVYLEYEGIGPTDILETRRILELAAARLAVQRLDQSGVARLKEQIAAEEQLDGRASPTASQRFHRLVAELSGDPALAFFTGIALQLTEAHSTYPRRSREERDVIVTRLKKSHRVMAQAIIAGDAVAVERRIERYFEDLKGWMEEEK